MDTKIALDPELLDHALAVSGEQAKILELVGALDWDDEFDYKAERSRG